jgi:hypothetical protein
VGHTGETLMLLCLTGVYSFCTTVLLAVPCEQNVGVHVDRDFEVKIDEFKALGAPRRRALDLPRSLLFSLRFFKTAPQRAREVLVWAQKSL